MGRRAGLRGGSEERAGRVVTEAEVAALVAEHHRMKRQLELAESYNFDRRGVTAPTALFDFYNYVRLGLGKPALNYFEWVRMRLGSMSTSALSNTEVFYHQPNAYFTGCGEGCSHPDCKKDCK